MQFTRNRITFALIGLLLVGGGSAAFAVLTTPHPARLALADVRHGNASPTATAMGAATTATTTSAPTTPPLSQPTATATTAAPPPQPTKAATLTAGQSIDISGRVTSVTVSANTFTMTWQGSIVTVDVTGATYSGDAHSLSEIKVGWSAEVHGVVQANGHLQATEVNASSGN